MNWRVLIYPILVMALWIGYDFPLIKIQGQIDRDNFTWICGPVKIHSAASISKARYLEQRWAKYGYLSPYETEWKEKAFSGTYKLPSEIDRTQILYTETILKLATVDRPQHVRKTVAADSSYYMYSDYPIIWTPKKVPS